MIHPHRHTHEPLREPVTVFLIGMRANRFRAAGRVLWTARQMPPMLRHLEQHPESGLLAYRMWFGRTTLLLSYWRSPEHLQRFAADPDAPHLQPWRDFSRMPSTDVGIWHETYQVQPGNAEGVYVNMPVFGLAEAIGHEPVGPGSRTARQRMGRRAEEEAAVA